MCVFFISMCFKILIKRWFWEIIVLIGSLIELHVGLHSYLCLSFLEKLVLKKWLDTSSIPPRHLAICRDSSAVSYRFLDSSSILGGSIEKAPTSSIASRHLVDWSSFCSWIWWVFPQYLLDTSAVNDHFLDTYLDSFLDTSRHLHLSRFTEGLYIPSSQSVCTDSSPKHSLSHSKPLPLRFFKLFQDSSSLGKFLISHSSCISCFET